MIKHLHLHHSNENIITCGSMYKLNSTLSKNQHKFIYIVGYLCIGEWYGDIRASF